jgi:hypothetical protein
MTLPELLASGVNFTMQSSLTPLNLQGHISVEIVTFPL